jgi:FkbM family methyltransferase
MTVQELNTRYGTMFVPDSDRGQYWWLANTGASPEDHFIEMMCELLDERPKATAVDVGANFGCWTLPLSKHAHRVIAVEPQYNVYKLLCKSVDASAIRNVMPLNIAAGEHPGFSQIETIDLAEGANFGGMQLAVSQNTAGKMEDVWVETLDKLLMGEQVSFMKIDVESYEARVIEGAMETIKRCKPLLFVEMDHPGTDRERLKAMIENMGYVCEQNGGNYLGMPI